MQPEPCQYIKEHCPELTEGFIDFLDLYYCTLTPRIGQSLGILVIVSILGLTFLFLGTVASDFFCPNLATIAQLLQLSESVAGVTFLAFGNGSPDLFSTFSALKAGSGALAFGELIGAAWFVVSVVVGSMAIVKSFQVVRHLFLRDLLFFTGAVIFMIAIIWDRVLSPGESLFLILYYISYVVTVLTTTQKNLQGETSGSFSIFPFNYSDHDSNIELGCDEELEGLLMSNLECKQYH